MNTTTHIDHDVHIAVGDVHLEGNLVIPSDAHGVVLFAHGSGSGRHSPRNRYVAECLQDAGLATLLFDLLTADEEAVDLQTAHLRFDIGRLAERLVAATDWLGGAAMIHDLPLGYFGASTGAAAALVAAAERPERVGAVVSRGGRPDLAGYALARVQAATLLIVGSRDYQVIGLNQQALQRLASPVKKLTIVPGARHLFEEPGALSQVAHLALNWFSHHLTPAAVPPP